MTPKTARNVPRTWRQKIHRSRTLTPGQKLIAYTLAGYMDAAGHCYPSHESLMRTSGYGSRNTVARLTRELAKAGYLKRRRQYRQGLGWRYLYWAAVPGDHVEVEPVRDPFEGGADVFG